MSLAAALNEEHLARRVPMSATDLDMGGKVVDPDTTNAVIVELFEADPDLNGVVVAQDGKPIGLINRNAFFARLEQSRIQSARCKAGLEPAWLELGSLE